MTEYYHLFPLLCCFFLMILPIFKIYKVVSLKTFVSLYVSVLFLVIFNEYVQNEIISILFSFAVFEFTYFKFDKIKSCFKKRAVNKAVSLCVFCDNKGKVLFDGKVRRAVSMDKSCNIKVGSIVTVLFCDKNILVVK